MLKREVKKIKSDLFCLFVVKAFQMFLNKISKNNNKKQHDDKTKCF